VAKSKVKKKLIIREAVAVFNKINQKIKSLIDCSARDFEILNLSFKEYHNTIKDLTDKATVLFKSAFLLPAGKINDELKRTEAIINSYKNAFVHIQDIDRQSINLINETSYSYLYFSNLKQNISTLKLLTTNIQLEPYYRKLYKNLLVTINNLSDCCQRFHHEFQQSEKLVKSGFEIIELIKNQHFTPFIQSIERVHKELSEMALKQSVCSGYNIIMDELLSRKSVSSSEIITNLQFQDIVQQKIEHVQFAHEELLKQLNDFYINKKEQVENKFELTLEIIFQIRNIGSLQAAQLVHANTEYQKAVKNITEKFGDLDVILDETMRLLNNFISAGESMEEYFYQEFDSFSSLYKESSEKIRHDNSALYKEFTELLSNTGNFNSAESSFTNSINKISSIFEELNNIKTTQKSNSGAVDTISQILVSFNEFRNNSNILCRILERNKLEILNKLIPAYARYFSIIESAIKDSNQLILDISEIVPKELNHRINKKNYIAEKDIYTTKFNISNVEYFKIFEKEVDEIITSLNFIIEQIDFNEVEGKIEPESLEKLKTMYTMRSERDIHALITGIKPEKRENESEIEIF
jgi:hypothetical protein